MTKSIYETIKLSTEQEDVVDYITSHKYLQKVKHSRSLKAKRTPSIRKRDITSKLKMAIEGL